MAFLSHLTAGSLWTILSFLELDCLHVSVPAHIIKRPPGITVHRRRSVEQLTITHRYGIPVTDPVTTLIDLATLLSPRQLETAINEADKRGLVSPEQLRLASGEAFGRPGVRSLRTVLDRHTFRLTDSELERYFLPISRAAGLPAPETGRLLNGFKVDFFWPDQGLVVETDGLRYHRTPAAQVRDRLRDQTHTAAGLTPLRFTHAQVAHQPRYVQTTLALVAQRLREA